MAGEDSEGEEGEEGEEDEEGEEEEGESEESQRGNIINDQRSRRAMEMVCDDRLTDTAFRHAARGRSLEDDLQTAVGTRDRISTLEAAAHALLRRAATADRVHAALAEGTLVVLAKFIKTKRALNRTERTHVVLYNWVSELLGEQPEGEVKRAQLRREMNEANAAHAEDEDIAGPLTEEALRLWGDAE